MDYWKCAEADGLYGRARRNADKIVVRRNTIEFGKLPPNFHNFTILHLSDLHADISEGDAVLGQHCPRLAV